MITSLDKMDITVPAYFRGNIDEDLWYWESNNFLEVTDGKYIVTDRARDIFKQRDFLAYLENDKQKVVDVIESILKEK